MSDQKKCKKCGACPECGASPQIVPMPYPVYPYGYPYVAPRPWNHYYQPYYYSNVTSGIQSNQSVGTGYATTGLS